MIQRYNNISLIAGVPGILLQIGSRIVPPRLLANAENMAPHQIQLIIAASTLSALVGTALLLVGLAYYAKAKKRSPWWCLFAFLSCLGLIVLACLKDLDDGKEESVAYLESLPEEQETPTYLAPIPEDPKD